MAIRAASWQSIERPRRTIPPRTNGARPDSDRLAALFEASRSNVVLNSLPDDLREELVAHATVLDLKAGDVVEHQGGTKRVFFPLSGMLTGLRTREDGSHYAFSHRGREAAVNAVGLARPEVGLANADVVVDVAGTALVLDVDYYRSMLERSHALTRAMLSHASHVINWREQAADCPGHHSVRARTANFLLMLRAHQCDDTLTVTHARIAEVLGVRRQSISEALGELKDRRVIALDRGRITVLDRKGLWRQACDCRRTVDSALQLQRAGRFEYTD